jgi:hypothetical protein
MYQSTIPLSSGSFEVEQIIISWNGTTLDTYSHVMPRLQEAAALRFEESLQQASELSASEMLANG